MDYREVPSFIIRLREVAKTAGAATALEFCILTATRANEAAGAAWDEIDLDAAVWTIPAGRMKTGAEHRVPLSSRCLEILKARAASKSGPYVFPGGRSPHKPLDPHALLYVLNRMGIACTVHGFRSSFRDWCGEETSTPREIAEAALAHVLGGVEGAYRRGDALQKRRALMAAWAAYVGSHS